MATSTVSGFNEDASATAASVSDGTTAEGAASRGVQAAPLASEPTCQVRFEAPPRGLERLRREAHEIIRGALGGIVIPALPIVHGLALVQISIPERLLADVIAAANDWFMSSAVEGLASLAPTRAQLADPDFIILVPRSQSQWELPIPPVREIPVAGWAADYCVYGADLFSAAVLDHTIVQAAPARNQGPGRGRGRGKPAPQGPRRAALRVWWHTEASRADALLLAITSGLRPAWGSHAWTKDVVWATLHVGLDRSLWEEDKAEFIAEIRRLFRRPQDLPPIVADGLDGATLTVCLPAGLVRGLALYALPETIGSGARVAYRGLPAEDGRAGTGRGLGAPGAEADVARCGTAGGAGAI
jgi:hypothetical protein